jgi:hypothetical protein
VRASKKLKKKLLVGFPLVEAKNKTIFFLTSWKPSLFFKTNMYKYVLAIIASLAAVAYAFDPITVVSGTTAYVLTSTQVAVAVASVGALALAAEGLILAELSRGKRSANDVATFKIDPLFDAIAAVDVADCGKLLVCNVHAKNAANLTVEESKIVKLFRSFNGKVDPLHAQAQYMLAAQTGLYKKPAVCVTQYIKCPYEANQLSSLLKQ